MPSRAYLIHLLTEAAEIEHNLLCSYLYAAFSLKGPNEGLSKTESEMVAGWRDKILTVAREEMGHLVLVNNLLVAVGGAAHFDRPNLPVPPGYHPAGFIIRLTPFTKDALQHFIFLERPEDSAIPDSDSFEVTAPPRTKTPGRLTPSTPDYETIGEFYDAIKQTLISYSDEHGERAFLNQGGRDQIGPDILEMDGIRIVTEISNALKALDTIVAQGEGSSTGNDDCHFAHFQAIAAEWDQLASDNTDFEPAFPAATDPVMRRPAGDADRVWITEPTAARRLDFGNAVYGLMLSLLTQCYAPDGSTSERQSFVAAALELMHVLWVVGSDLARIAASPTSTGNAGLTFAVPRNIRPRAVEWANALLRERLAELSGTGLFPECDRYLEKAQTALSSRK